MCVLIVSNSVRSQEKKNLFKSIYNELFKYGTLYVAGDARSPYEQQRKDYFIRTNPDDLYDVPQVVDETIYHPFDYRYGIGFRRLARYDFEIKQNYIDGTENMTGLSSPTESIGIR